MTAPMPLEEALRASYRNSIDKETPLHAVVQREVDAALQSAVDAGTFHIDGAVIEYDLDQVYNIPTRTKIIKRYCAEYSVAVKYFYCNWGGSDTVTYKIRPPLLRRVGMWMMSIFN